MAWPLGVIRMVEPSGGDLATRSAPRLPPAPGLLSTITGWRNASCSLLPTSRASTSTAPPAANGTMMRTGLFGKLCADTGSADKPKTTARAQISVSGRIPYSPKNSLLILRRDIRFLHDFCKLRQIRFEARIECPGGRADGLIAHRLEPPLHVRIGDHFRGFALEEDNDVARRLGGHEPALPAGRFESGNGFFSDSRHVRQRSRTLGAVHGQRTQSAAFDQG